MRKSSIGAGAAGARWSILARAAAVTCWAVSVGLSGVGSAHAGLFDDEEARKAILDLRTRIDNQQRESAARDAELQDQITTFKRSILDLNNQLETARAELARLRGQDEQTGQTLRELARDLAEFQRKQKDSLATLEERLRRFEPQRLLVDGREGVVEQEEKRAFDEALGVLRKGDFAAAVSAFQLMLRRFPDSLYAGQAKYWTGSAQYGKGDVKDALATFRGFVATYPDHPRVPDALLSVANCQVELKDAKAARRTLEDLMKAHPQSEAAKAARDRLAMLK
jgi:tol-pal system protein YbgF